MSGDALTAQRRFSWRLGFPLLVLGGAVAVVAALLFYSSPDFDLGTRNFGLVAVAFMSAALLSLWFLFLPWSLWFVRLGLVLVVVGAARGAVRELSFSGDFVPVVQWRWQPAPDDVLDAHRLQNPAAPGKVEVRAEEEADFPAYRNRDRDGIVRGPRLSRDWTAQPPRELWRQPVGRGYAALAIVGDAAVTIEQRRDQEAVVCYRATTGQEVWVYSYPAAFTEALGGPGPRATPTIADGKVYSLGALGHLACLDLATGAEVWFKNVLQDNANIQWAMSGSPLVFDRLVVVNPGAQTKEAAGRAVLAFDRATGQPVWHAGDHPAGYSSPQLATLKGQRQILIFDGDGLAGHDPATGRELWRHEWKTMNNINVAQPIVLDGDRVFISTGYGVGCALLQVSEQGGQWSTATVWQNKNMRCKFTSPVLRDGFLYGLDEGILVCLDPRTGERRWRDGRFGHGQILLHDDLLLVLSDTGEFALVEAKPEAFRKLAGIRALTGKTWNYPAVAHGRAYLRNDREMVCYDLAAK
ncbi:MAG: PQQ-like beta-propeller repeat protein [Planctomycetia bacterium]|nr:PQQ-like beta-propeller repeat protein [Planctomycetia bacterium]